MWASRITTSHFCSPRRRWTSRRAASTGEPNARPSQCAESSIAGTAGVVSPTTPTRTPPTSLTIEVPNAGWPPRVTLAASHGKVEERRARSSAPGPKLNSWFPTAIAS